MPFTVDQFFDVFEAYNHATWPVSILLWVLAAGAALAVIFKRPYAHKFALIVLAILWAWSGTVYQFIFFAGINPAARVFGIAFILEAILFLGLAFSRRGLGRPMPLGVDQVAGTALIVYALIVYPLLNFLSGHVAPRAPTFGAPCPVTIFTLAMLLLIRAPFHSAVVPVLWALIGSFAAILFGIYADLGLMIAAIFFALSRSVQVRLHS